MKAGRESISENAFNIPPSVSRSVSAFGADSGSLDSAIKMSIANTANAIKTAGQRENCKIKAPILGAIMGMTAIAPARIDITCAARFPS